MLGKPNLIAFPIRPGLCGSWTSRAACSLENKAGSEERSVGAEDGVESAMETEMVVAEMEEAPAAVVVR